MYYEDGTLAAVGDIVVGKSDNQKGTIIGMVGAVATTAFHIVRVRVLATVVEENGIRRTSIIPADADYTSARLLRKVL